MRILTRAEGVVFVSLPSSRERRMVIVLGRAIGRWIGSEQAYDYGRRCRDLVRD